jgi:hypothetical protein
MRKRDAHRKLMTLLCFAMGTTLALLAGCGALLPEQRAPKSTDQLTEAFDQIVPGMTRADDLPHLGFDTSAASVGVLSSRAIAQRFARAAGDPAVRDCIRDEIYCTGFVFHPAPHRAGIAATFGFQQVANSRPADIILLVMNGRVIHKVFSESALPNQGGARIASAAF